MRPKELLGLSLCHLPIPGPQPWQDFVPLPGQGGESKAHVCWPSFGLVFRILLIEIPELDLFTKKTGSDAWPGLAGGTGRQFQLPTTFRLHVGSWQKV